MDSSITVAIIGGVVTIANVVFTAVFTAIKERRRVKTREEQNIEDGLQCLLRAEIIRSHEKYTARGYCPIYARESLDRAYAAYHNLGGNDIATSLYKECMELPKHPSEHNGEHAGGHTGESNN